MRIGVVGCGTGGPAAALLLARAGHEVELLEQAPDPRPIGAGFLLQPTGLSVLARLGVLDEIRAGAEPIDRLHGETASGRVIMDLSYSALRPGLHALGVRRGVGFSALYCAVAREGIPVRTGARIVAREPSPDGARATSRAGGGAGATDRAGGAGAGGVLVAADGARHGPYDLVVAADGARSALRAGSGIPGRATPYPWGAVWTVLRDPDRRFAGALSQVYRGTREMIGFLATGDGTVAFFSSLPARKLASLTVAGVHRQVRSLTRRADPLLKQLESADQLVPAVYHDVVLDRLHAEGLVLLGDAGHATSPQLGQGANLGLLDAAVLADTLPNLAAYSEARRRHLRFYSVASRAMTPFFQSSRDRLAIPRDALLPLACRTPWVRGQMLRAMAGVKTGVLAAGFEHLLDERL